MAFPPDMHEKMMKGKMPVGKGKKPPPKKGRHKFTPFDRKPDGKGKPKLQSWRK